MKKILISLLLLVITSFELTHANTIEILEDKNAIDSLRGISLKAQYDTFKVKESRIAKRNIPGPSSVVQDWNLVCRELCGAGLGGPECGPQCKKIIDDFRRNNQTSQVKDLLGQNKSILCSVLCTSGLGDPLCKCSELIGSDAQSHITSEHNIICSSFCDHNSVTLTGCSPCIKLNFNNNQNEKIYNVLKYISTTATSTKMKPKLTTPNWDRLCVDLCKTGDGGALCNCDLPPFF